MAKSSLPGTRTRGRHRKKVEPRTWQHATPPRVIGYAVAVFLTIIAVSSAYRPAEEPQAAPAPDAAARPAAQFLPPRVTPTVPDLSTTTPQLMASETPAAGPTARPKPATKPAGSEKPEPVKTPEPVTETSAPVESVLPKPTEPPATQPPTTQPPTTQPPAEDPGESTPPSEPPTSEPSRPGLLPGLGDVVGGITDPLLGRG